MISMATACKVICNHYKNNNTSTKKSINQVRKDVHTVIFFIF